MYGATSADFTLTSGGRVVPGATLTIWSARTGGTQITDLLDKDSVATTTVTSDADGSIVYYGPNNDKTVHWADSGVGNRIAVRPTDITGDPPVLSIGTVGTGTAAASLTGTSEAPVLNLTLPSAGANGVNTAAIQDSAVTSAKIADGTIVNDDINASAAIARSKISGLPTSSTDNTVARFDSTAGAIQTSGVVIDDNNRLTVATGATGGYGFASGAVHLSGTGSPEGVVTAAPGSTWLQTDATTDVKGWIRWVKATGTGNTGWVAGAEADTGWRDVSASLTNGWTGTLHVRRVGGVVEVLAHALSAASATSGVVYTLPAGFRPGANASSIRGIWYKTDLTMRRINIDTAGQITVTGYAAGDTLYGSESGFAQLSTGWPSSLPGSAWP
jgi:hypothetical protein